MSHQQGTPSGPGLLPKPGIPWASFPRLLATHPCLLLWPALTPDLISYPPTPQGPGPLPEATEAAV